MPLYKPDSHNAPQPKLAVIIVSYNVEYFLEQCLHSVIKASKNHLIEVWVVDNNSTDGSVEMTQRLFPEVIVIANKDNKGFSKANNQAMRETKAQYCLLLNPDTLVEESTFDKCITFMDAHPNAGGLGVKMVDGKGQFLAESKRGLPTPMVAFYKIFGLSSIFPKSKTFGQYHQGHLDKDKNHKIDILAGAFMLMRSAALEKVGLLDEDFFMYGEDIDLSWRIKLGGYDNYYFADTTIIHYKGESTKKSSVNYVLVFYNAMIIFAKKHFSKSNASFFEILIRIAIYFRASVALTRRFLERFYLSFFDLTTLILSLVLITVIYQQYTEILYPVDVMKWLFPANALVMVGSIFIAHGYSKNPLITRILKGGGWGIMAAMLVYGLLDETYRFSRAIMLVGSITGVAGIIAYRSALRAMGINAIEFSTQPAIRVAIIGKPTGISRVKSLLEKTTNVPQMVLEVHPDYTFKNNGDHFVASLGQLPDAISVFDINQIIFCGEDMSSSDIINEMITQQNAEIELKIAPPNSNFIIGSQNINTSGEILSIDSINTFLKQESLQSKRLFDVFTALVLAAFSPLLIWRYPQKWQFIKNILQVLIGNKTWIGFIDLPNHQKIAKSIKPCVISMYPDKQSANTPVADLENMNLRYAQKYSSLNDLSIIWQFWHKLDN